MDIFLPICQRKRSEVEIGREDARKRGNGSEIVIVQEMDSEKSLRDKEKLEQ